MPSYTFSTILIVYPSLSLSLSLSSLSSFPPPFLLCVSLLFFVFQIPGDYPPSKSTLLQHPFPSAPDHCHHLANPFVILAPYFYPYHVLHYYFQSEMGVIRRRICTDRFIDIGGPAFSMAYNVFLFGVLFLVPVILLGFTCGSIAKRLMSLTEDEKMLKNSVRKEDASRKKVLSKPNVTIYMFFPVNARKIKTIKITVMLQVDHIVGVLYINNEIDFQNVLLG